MSTTISAISALMHPTTWKEGYPNTVRKVLDNPGCRRRDTDSEPPAHRAAWTNILVTCIKMHLLGCTTAGYDRRLGIRSRPPSARPDACVRQCRPGATGYDWCAS